MENKSELIDTLIDIGRKCLWQRQSMSLKADISQGDFIAIDLLKAGEKISCKELSRKMELSVSRISRIIDRLLAKGYVSRRGNPRDRRAVQVSLSVKGIRLKKNIEKLKAECERKVFGVIDPENVEIVKKGMTILHASLQNKNRNY